MKMAARISCCMLLVLGISACGIEGPGEGALSPIDFYETAADSSFTVSTRQEITGSGTVIMTEPLPAPISSDSFHMRINLLDADSSVTLVTHALTKNLSGGIRLTFSTPNSVDVDAEIVSDLGRIQANSSVVESKYASDSIHVYIDIHMEDAEARVLVWNDLVANFEILDTDLNSDTYGNVGLYNPGTYWGLILNNATVTLAQLDATKLVP